MSDCDSDIGKSGDLCGSPRSYSSLSIQSSSSSESSQENENQVDLDTISLCMHGSVKVTVVKGDITSQKVDVILSGVTGRLDLGKGALAQAVVKKAGSSLQTELREKYPDGIKPGDFAISGAGDMLCEEVYHVCIPKYEGQNTKVLRDVFYKCFEKASVDGHESIAMPALGTGMLGYESKIVAKTISSVVSDFNQQHPDSSLKNVYCVIHPAQQSVIKAFSEIFRDQNQGFNPGNVCQVQFDNICVKLKIGKLTEEQCDIIVGTCTRTLDLKKGSLSKAILEASGPEIQAECSAKYPQGIKHGDVAVLSPGKLGCHKVYLGALLRFNKTGDASETPTQILDKLVLNSLVQAAKDKKSSICMPPFGTGFLKFPPAVSAQTILQAIQNFSTNNPSIAMTVKVILHQDGNSIKKTLQPFKSAVNTYKDGNTRGASAGSSRNYTITPDRFTPAFCRHMYTQFDHRPPPYWTSFDDSQSLKEWNLKSGSSNYTLVDVSAEERNIIVNLIQDTWEADKKGNGRDAKGLNELQFNALKVNNVQRVENLNMFEKYLQTRAQLFLKAGNKKFPALDEIEEMVEGIPKTQAYLDDSWGDRLYGEVNECYFFHGTKSDCVESVMKEGIDVKMAAGGAVFGSAVYMAESSTKADQYTDPKEKRQMTGLKMFLMRASLGHVCVKSQLKKYRKAPCVQEGQGCGDDKCNHDRYDSIVEERKFIFREFVVYDSLQTYPEYIISYDRV